MFTASCGDDDTSEGTTAEARDDVDIPEDDAPADALPTPECDEAMAEAAAVGDIEDAWRIFGPPLVPARASLTGPPPVKPTGTRSTDPHRTK